MSPFPLTIGLNPSPFTQALFDGSVRPKDVDLHLQSRFGEGLDNVGARHRAIIAGELHGGELSISSFILARLRGVPLRALPVFLSRRFRLRCMYCRVDSAVNHPSELAGKSVDRAPLQRYNTGLAQGHPTKRVRCETRRSRLVCRGARYRRRKSQTPSS